MKASEKGVACPRCGSPQNLVTDSRPQPQGRYIRRRRRCDCGERFTTMEIVVPRGSRALVLNREAMASAVLVEVSSRLPALLVSAVNRAWPVGLDDDDA